MGPWGGSRMDNWESVLLDSMQKPLGLALFVFLRDDPQKNGMSLFTPVPDSVFNALSDGTIHFALYGSSLNHDLIC